jgi:electron transport complex protein RnfA
MRFVQLFINAVLVSNVILATFLGLCPFMGVSKNTRDALGMSCAVLFVIVMSSAATFTLDWYVLKPLFMESAPELRIVLHTIAFILVIAALVQLVEMILRKYLPPLYKALGIYLPLITTNCAVLGMALLTVKRYGGMETFGEAIIWTLCDAGFSALGFAVAMMLMSGIRERLELMDVPDPMRGWPIAFVCAGLMAFAFFGFQGLSFG